MRTLHEFKRQLHIAGSRDASRAAVRRFASFASGEDTERIPKFRHALGAVAARTAKLEEGAYDPKLWSNICRELYFDLRLQSPQNISLTLNSLARLRVRDTALLDHIASTLTANWLRNFNVQDLALVCNSYARFTHASPRLFQLCAEELVWKLPDGTPQELALVAGACAKVRAYNATLFRHLGALTVHSLQDFGPRHAANVLHAFARVDAVAPHLYSALAGRLSDVKLAAELEAIAVAQVCFAVSRSVSRYPAALEHTSRPLLDVLARRFVAIGREPGAHLDVHHIAALARACLDAGAFSRPLIRFLITRIEAPAEMDMSAPNSRSMLLDAVDAAASLRALLASTSVHGTKLSDEARSLEERIYQVLSVLRDTKAATVMRKQGWEVERRRLAVWDGELGKWLPDKWQSGLRQGLLG